MPDTVVTLGDAVLQHGPFSDRVYVMKVAAGAAGAVLDRVQELAEEEEYGKVVVKARGSDFGAFALRGFRAEALIPGFFAPGEPCVFMGKFLDPDRGVDPRAADIGDVVRAARGRAPSSGEGPGRPGVSPEGPADPAPPGVEVRAAGPDDAAALAACYARVFESYPFPIHEPEHLRREMSRGTRFFGAWEGETLVAASSMETGGAPGVVEMTDFATLPSHRGRGLATSLLATMDREADASGVRVAFTIARALSFGMNITFARRGYRYGGTLVNNTQIGGSIESMNVWYRPPATSGRTAS